MRDDPGLAGERRRLFTKTGWADFDSDAQWVDLGLVLVCLTCAALAAGLTLATASLEPLDLKVTARAGAPADAAAARRLLPLTTRQPRHWLLVTHAFGHMVLFAGHFPPFGQLALG